MPDHIAGGMKMTNNLLVTNLKMQKKKLIDFFTVKYSNLIFNKWYYLGVVGRNPDFKSYYYIKSTPNS